MQSCPQNQGLENVPMRTVTVVGGGLAEGVPVRLYEMRPARPTPVHRSDRLAELVCSDSLKSIELSTPHGLLKAEMGRLGSAGPAL